MSVPTLIAARCQRARTEMRQLCEKMADRINIEPPTEVPGSLHDRPSREALDMECITGFLERANAAIVCLTAAAARKDKSHDRQRMDQATATV